MLTEQLKVYKDVVELSKMLHRLTTNFPRYEKYSVGAKLFNDSLDLIRYIAHANRDIRERERWLTEFLVCFETIKTLLRLSYEEGFLPSVALKRVTQLVITIEKQATGWKRSAAQKSGIG